MKFFKSNKRAFTILEVMISILVLEIGLLGIAAFYSSSFKITRIARNETLASNLASGILEQELALSYENLAVGTGIKEKYSSDVNSPFFNWEKQVDIAYVDQNLAEQPTDTNLKKITVTVYWQDNNEKSLQTASIKARH